MTTSVWRKQNAMGGATLPIESSQIHTLNRGFKLTGRLGEVMKESAEIAYSYVISHLKDYGCDQDFFDMSMVHLHVPEGATPTIFRSGRRKTRQVVARCLGCCPIHAGI